MADEFWTIPQLANEIGVSANTVRRYLQNYGQFFRSSKMSGRIVYPKEETLIVLRRISELSGSGRRIKDVLSTLEREFEPVSDPGEPEEIQESHRVELGPETLTVLQEIEKSLQSLSSLGEIEEALKRLTDTLKKGEKGGKK